MTRRSLLALVPAAALGLAGIPAVRGAGPDPEPLPALLRRRDALFGTPDGPRLQRLAESMLPEGGATYASDYDLGRNPRRCLVREWKDGAGYHRAIVG